MSSIVGLALGADLGEPGTQRVCVPSEDGRSWECGTKDKPPPARGLRERPANADPAPPPFLAHPEYRAGGSEVTAIPEPEPVAAAPSAPDEFAGSGRTDDSSTESATPTTNDSEVGTSDAMAAETLPAPVDLPAETPAAAETAVAEEATYDSAPVATAEPTSEPPTMLAAPESETVMLAPGPAVSGGEAPPVVDDTSTAMPEPPPPPSDYVSAETTGDFLGLDPARFTVQLARASSSDGFDTLLARLDVSSTATYRVAMGDGSSATWVLLWGDYADIDSARQAARALPAELVRGAWPRKIGPLQDEARRSGSAPIASAPTASAPTSTSEPTYADAPAVSAPAPAPASTAPVALPRDAALSGALEDAGADAFLRLPAQHFTVQLVSASDALAAQAIAASAELDTGTVYVLRLNPAGKPTWIVVAGVHADLASARAQQARLARNLPAASVRRIGPLQAEVRAAARP